MRWFIQKPLTQKAVASNTGKKTHTFIDRFVCWCVHLLWCFFRRRPDCYRCLCQVARQIGFCDQAVDVFNLEKVFGIYRQVVIYVFAILSLNFPPLSHIWFLCQEDKQMYKQTKKKTLSNSLFFMHSLYSWFWNCYILFTKFLFNLRYSRIIFTDYWSWREVSFLSILNTLHCVQHVSARWGDGKGETAACKILSVPQNTHAQLLFRHCQG